MNLGRCRHLKRLPLGQTWFRAIESQFLATPHATSHTRRVRSRFNPGPDGNPRFETLYLSHDPLIALQEVEAVVSLGGITVPNPTQKWSTVRVDIVLQYVVDLTDVLEQQRISTTAQELTGDFRGYHLRNPTTLIKKPFGIAPTQLLGQKLFDLTNIEGFLTLSAKDARYPNFVIFPGKLQTSSYLVFYDQYGVKSKTLP